MKADNQKSAFLKMLYRSTTVVNSVYSIHFQSLIQVRVTFTTGQAELLRRLFPRQPHPGPPVSMGGFPARCPNHLEWLLSMWRGCSLAPRSVSGTHWWCQKSYRETLAKIRFMFSSPPRGTLRGFAAVMLSQLRSAFRTKIPEHKDYYVVKSDLQTREKPHFGFIILARKSTVHAASPAHCFMRGQVLTIWCYLVH